MKRFILLIGAVLCFSTLAFAQTDLQPVAIVRLTKSEPITVKQLRTEVEQREKQAGRALTAAERRQVLDLMINERLVLQAAERDRVTVSDSEINQYIGQMRTVMAQSIGRQPTDAEFTQALKNETGLDLPAYREQIRRQLLLQKYLTTKKESLFKTLKVPTDAEIMEFYNVRKSELVRPESVRLSMIQVPFGTDRTKARNLADQLVREIGSNPGKFDEAVVRSQSPNTGYQGGDFGYLPRNAQALQVVGQNFLNAAFSLKQGEISRVIESPTGYCIIKVTETYEQKNLALDDIIQLGTRMTVKDYIGNGLLQERQSRLLEQATQELVTELRNGNPFQIYENNIKW